MISDPNFAFSFFQQPGIERIPLSACALFLLVSCLCGRHPEVQLHGRIRRFRSMEVVRFASFSLVPSRFLFLHVCSSSELYVIRGAPFSRATFWRVGFSAGCIPKYNCCSIFRSTRTLRLFAWCPFLRPQNLRLLECPVGVWL